MAYKQKQSSCAKMVDAKGKPAGLMAEGSMAHMEYISQEKSNLMQDMPIDNRGVSQMSPYKMDYGSPNKKTNLDEFGNPIPADFKADAAGVTGTSKKISTEAGGNIVNLGKGESVSTQDFYKVRKIKEAKQGYGDQLTEKDKKKVAKLRLNDQKKSASEISKGLGLGKRITVISKDS